jgi:hypothetical protein
MGLYATVLNIGAAYDNFQERRTAVELWNDAVSSLGHIAPKGISRLLCDDTNLREGGEVKGKQNRGVSKPVGSNAKKNPLPAGN